MKKWLYRTMRGVLFCLLASAVTVVAQNNQQQSKQRPAGNTSKPAQRPQQGQKPVTKPNPGNGQRPQPSKPGQQPGNGRPNPGNGNVRPQPSHPKPEQPISRPNPGRPNPGPAPRPPTSRPPQWGRPPAHRPPYHFRPNDWAYLHRYYSRNLVYINRSRRPVFVIGGYFPYADIRYITPLPPTVYGYLPPPPPGYQMGYYQGYVVVYDPVTYFIVNVIDLLR